MKKTLNSSLFFGLTDQNKTLRNRTSVDSKDSICYYGINGLIWNQKSQVGTDGKGIKEGQIITMRISPLEGKILWSVDSEIRGSVTSGIFKEKGRMFVPYVEFFHKNDEI